MNPAGSIAKNSVSLRVFLHASQQVNGPQLVSEPRLLPQPHNPETSPFADNGEHVRDFLV
jgi:hypothetical protein